MSTLSDIEIRKRLNTNNAKAIIVTPILDESLQIKPIGIDCRLGNQFIIFKTQSIDSYDIKDEKKKDQLKKLHKEVVVPFGFPFVLHPQTMVLGSTFEFIGIPYDLEASIEGRSSWARLGLNIATAVYIEPGFKGCVTLELANISNVPIKLYPGVRIAQLIFRDTSSSSMYKSDKYNYPIGPEISRAIYDDDIEFFLNFDK